MTAVMISRLVIDKEEALHTAGVKVLLRIAFSPHHLFEAYQAISEDPQTAVICYGVIYGL